MARGFNKVILMGNLARDPEMRYTADQRACARFAVAVNNTWKDKSGEKQESCGAVKGVQSHRPECLSHEIEAAIKKARG